MNPTGKVNHATLGKTIVEGPSLAHPGSRAVWGAFARRAQPRFGLDDESVFKVNPKRVITHVSGFGQSGDEDYIRRASYDIVGQAFGRSMSQTGFADPAPPTRAAPWTADYMTALFTLWSSLAGLIHARATGKGQSIDVAQFESVHRTLGGTMIEYFEKGLVRERSGNRGTGFQPLDTFAAKDGWVVIGAVADVYKRLCPVSVSMEKTKSGKARVSTLNQLRESSSTRSFEDGSANAPSTRWGAK